MDSDQGFLDLRLNRQHGQNNESFWPSFTDIMTVIVMIFLIAMVVLLMRNMELVNQLRATMEAERMAAELARATGEEKDTLAMKLIATENQLSELRMELLRMKEEREANKETIQEQVARITQLINARDLLRQQSTQLAAEAQRYQTESERLQSNLTRTREDLAQRQEELDKSQRQISELQFQQQTSQQQLASLQGIYQTQSEELDRYRNQLSSADQRLSSLRGEYDELKVKYDKLVKPARTAQGKYVVEVMYRKLDGQLTIAYREDPTAEFKTVTRAQLEEQLAALKEEKSNQLYIKVIIPENSGLSYNEAWEFTSRLHKRYDYYFQDAAQNTAE